VASLEQFFGGAMPDEIRRSTDVLTDAARTLQREVDMNRRVLRHAIEAGEKFVRTLVDSAAPPAAGYPTAPGTPERSAGGAILDRRV
jgi:hypothetical protein